MEHITAGSQNQFNHLKDSMTTFLIVFETEKSGMSILPDENSIWERSDINIDRDAVYPHIQRFLIGNIPVVNTEINEQACLFYSLKDGRASNTPLLESIGHLFNGQSFFINGKQTNDKGLVFRLLNRKNTLASPKLILYPQASIGVLMISLELVDKDYGIDDLIMLNYRLHKIDDQEPLIKLFSKGNNIPEEKKQYSEVIKRREEKLRQKYAEVYSLLNEYKPITKNKKENDEPGWKLSTLVVTLLSDLNKNGVQTKLFNESRMHPITYLQTNDGYESHIRDFVRIIRCQNESYKVLEEEQILGKLYAQTFENIYVGASVEGAAVMTVAEDDASDFISTYKTNSYLSRYLWIYLLTYIQRQTLIKITKELIEIDANTAYNSKNALSHIVSRLSVMKINSYFTNISDHTQHNTFYTFCSDRLSVKMHMEEVKDKIDDIGMILKEQEFQQNEQNEKNEKERNDKLQEIIAKLMLPQIYLALMVFLCLEIDLEMFISKALSWYHYLFAGLAVIGLGYFLIPVIKLFGFYRRRRCNK